MERTDGVRSIGHHRSRYNIFCITKDRQGHVMKQESVEEFLKRGGKVQKLARGESKEFVRREKPQPLIVTPKKHIRRKPGRPSAAQG
jgi:hypothetical protein